MSDPENNNIKAWSKVTGTPIVSKKEKEPESDVQEDVPANEISINANQMLELANTNYPEEYNQIAKGISRIIKENATNGDTYTLITIDKLPKRMVSAIIKDFTNRKFEVTEEMEGGVAYLRFSWDVKKSYVKDCIVFILILVIFFLGYLGLHYVFSLMDHGKLNMDPEIQGH